MADKEITVEDKLKRLYELQKVMSKMDKNIAVRGELPLEVADLEDEIVGLETHLNKLNDDIRREQDRIVEYQEKIRTANEMIAKRNVNLDNVRNNREYEMIEKELGFQKLDIELSEKKIREAQERLDNAKKNVVETQDNIDYHKKELEHKKIELEEIMKDTQEEQDELMEKAEKLEHKIPDERLVKVFKKIRKSARNGLAIVPVQREACGGCYNRIPPQKVVDIRTHKKLIFCEYCGRILVDPELVEKKKIKE